MKISLSSIPLKLFILFLSILVMPLMVFSQTTTTPAEQEEFDNEYDLEVHTISGYGENNLFLEKGTFAYNFGTRLDLNSEIFGFYYKVGMGVNPDGKLYAHVPLGLEAGVILAGYALATGNNSYYLLLPAVICAIVPEGITARVYRRKNYNIKLYASPWGSELNITKENFTMISGEFGVQTSVINKHKYNLSCYAGAKALYKHFQPMATVGATIGILLD